MLNKSKLLFMTGVFYLLTATVTCLPQGDYEYEEDNTILEAEAEYSTSMAVPPKFLDHGGQLKAEVGSTIKFPCNSQNPGELHMVFMYTSPKGKDRVIFAGKTVILRQSRRWSVNDWTYILNGVKKSDKGTYECRYELEEETVSIQYTLDVLFPAEIKLETKPVQTVMQGGDTQMACSAVGNPEPKISWIKEDGHLPAGKAKEQGDSIIFQDVDRHVEGTYICIADNGVGKQATASTILQVNYKPEIISEKAIIHTGEGSKAELVCVVHGRPEVTVSWLRGDSPVNSNNHHITHDGQHRHTLTIENVEYNDMGPYTCLARNELGESEKTLSVTGLPKPVKMTSSPTGAESDTYTLTWMAESFAPIREYRIKFKKVQDEVWQKESNMAPPHNNTIEEISGAYPMKHSLKFLEPATDYHALVSVKNKYGWSDETDAFEFCTKKEVAVGHSASKASYKSIGFTLIALTLSITILS